MAKMRTFEFTEGSDTKTVEAMSYRKAVKSYPVLSKAFSSNCRVVRFQKADITLNSKHYHWDVKRRSVDKPSITRGGYTNGRNKES